VAELNKAKAFRIIECETGEEFIESIRPDNKKLWVSNLNNRWGFRGQPDCNYRLIPKAFRSNIKLPTGPFYITPPEEPSKQGAAETNTIRKFVEYALKNGLEIPDETYDFIFPNYQHPKIPYEDWPQPEYLNILALAQHHGIPTRLLDFTNNPLIAAFFAFDQVPNDRIFDKESRVSVWGIDFNAVFRMWSQYDSGSRIKKIVTPAAGNTFLHRQEGFFLLDDEANSYYNPEIGYPSFDSIILDKADEKGIDEPVIIRVDVAYTEKVKVIDTLKQYNIIKPGLMPTYSDIADYIMEMI